MARDYRRDRFYELPNQEGLLRVLGAVPKNWAFVDGGLDFAGGQIAGVSVRPDGVAILSCNRMSSRFVLGGRKAEPFELLGEKLTSKRVISVVKSNGIQSVRFERAGLDGGPMPYKDCFDVLNGLVAEGFGGKAVYLYSRGFYTDVCASSDYEAVGFDHKSGYLKTVVGGRGRLEVIKPVLEVIKELGLKPLSG
ncbi:MAG: hypothetical protein ABH864_02450 [archaeon]